MADRKTMSRKQHFVNLYENEGRGYFKDCRIDLFPNGETGELWIQSKDGRFSMSIKASLGPAGLGIHITNHVGTPPITATSGQGSLEDTEISLCQYGTDEKSQAFKKWYNADVPYQLQSNEDCKLCTQAGRGVAKQYIEERDSINKAMADVPLFKPQTPDEFLALSIKPVDEQLAECFKKGFWEVLAHLSDTE